MEAPFCKSFHVYLPRYESNRKAWWRAWMSSERKQTVAKIKRDLGSHLPQSHTWKVAGFTCKIKQEKPLLWIPLICIPESHFLHKPLVARETMDETWVISTPHYIILRAQASCLVCQTDTEGRFWLRWPVCNQLRSPISFLREKRIEQYQKIADQQHQHGRSNGDEYISFYQMVCDLEKVAHVLAFLDPGSFPAVLQDIFWHMSVSCPLPLCLCIVEYVGRDDYRWERSPIEHHPLDRDFLRLLQQRKIDL